MKIVLDTNVIVSGLLTSGGNPAQVVSLALSGGVQICHDARVLAEYAEVLRRPRFKFDPKRVREVLTKLEIDGVKIDARSQRALACLIPTTNVFWPWLSRDWQIFLSPEI